MVNHFRQCLSLDEHRIRFSPQPYMSDTADTSATVTEIRVKPSVKEVWFSGCHSNVGTFQSCLARYYRSRSPQPQDRSTAP
jgi:hypothetical protein